MTEYTTILGDTWNLIAYKMYNGQEGGMEKLIMANRELAEILVFPANVKIKVPDEVITPPRLVPFWRKQADIQARREAGT